MFSIMKKKTYKEFNEGKMTNLNRKNENEKQLFDINKMKSFIKMTAKNKKYVNTLKAIDFAFEKHQGQFRKKSDIPYIIHPLNLACHALALGIEEDSIIASCLLHDTIEDCGVKENDLPVDIETKEIVVLLTHNKNNGALIKYYSDISKNNKACIIKLLDRYNNLTTMSWAFSKIKMIDYINETEEYILPLLNIIESVSPYNNIAWLLSYEIRSIIDVYKRLL